MNKSEYREKMDTLVNDKNTYQKLKSDPAKQLQSKLNEKPWPLHLANIIKKVCTHNFVVRLPKLRTCMYHSPPQRPPSFTSFSLVLHDVS